MEEGLRSGSGEQWVVARKKRGSSIGTFSLNAIYIEGAVILFTAI